MSDLPERIRPSEAALNDAMSHAAPDEDALPAPRSDELQPAMPDVDREASEVFAGIAPGDLTYQGGDVITSESVVPGAELTGTVVGVSDDEAFLEFGPKCAGVLPRSQFGAKEVVEVGRRIDVVVEKYDSDAGLLIVSRKGAIRRATWVNLSRGMIVEGRVTGVIKGGLEVDLKGIRAFMPG